ncbi:MAG: glutaredoxin domain-containing protein, partial [Burkholderiaceae bacterium]
IQDQLQAAPVVLFMKGTPDFPQCGFSAQTAAALKACNARFKHVNIFEDPELRESLNAGLLLAQWRPSSPLVRALRPLADQVAGAGAPRPAAWFDRLLGRRTAEPEPLAQTLPRPAGAIARRSGADSAGHALPQTRHPG